MQAHISYNIYNVSHTCNGKVATLIMKCTLYIRYRTSNHNLPVEVGRYITPINLERNDRKCELCNVSDIGDEYHYMLICNYFAIDRKKFIPSQFYVKPSVDKFCQLMKSQKKSLLINIAKMCKVIFEKFKE